MRHMQPCMMGACVILLSLPVTAGQPTGNLQVSVDPRVELIGLVFRLAGNPEYNNGRVAAYNKDVDEHFGRFRDHAAITMARQLRNEQGISFDACMSLAVHIAEIKTLQPRAPLESPGTALESRWKTQTAGAFLAQLRQFTTDSEFERFFEEHRDLYAKSEQRMRDLLSKEAHLEWFEEYFGPKSGASFHVVVGMLNGGGNYGVRFLDASGREDLYSVIGVSQTDDNGLPVFDRGHVELLVHEFTHSFVNHVVERHRPELEPAGVAMYGIVGKAMAAQAYGNWKTMLDELFVRAAVVRYSVRYYGKDAAERILQGEEDRSFVWIRQAADLLARYERSREQFPTFEAYFPEISRYFQENASSLAEQAGQRAAELEPKRPRVVSIVPASGDTDVDPATTSLVITFDRPMRAGYSLIDGGPGKGIFPEVNGRPQYDESRKVLTVPVKLKPGQRYRFSLNGDHGGSFRDDDGTPLARLDVWFSTRAQ